MDEITVEQWVKQRAEADAESWHYTTLSYMPRRAAEDQWVATVYSMVEFAKNYDLEPGWLTEAVLNVHKYREMYVDALMGTSDAMLDEEQDRADLAADELEAGLIEAALERRLDLDKENP